MWCRHQNTANESSNALKTKCEDDDEDYNNLLSSLDAGNMHTWF